MKVCLLAILLCSPIIAYPQNQTQLTAGLRHKLSLAKHDTSRVLILAHLGIVYRTIRPDSALQYGRQALTLARRINFIPGQVAALRAIGFTYRELGDLPQAMRLLLEGLSLGLHVAENQHVKKEIPHYLACIGSVYTDLSDYNKALYYYRSALREYEKITSEHSETRAYSFMVLGQAHRGSNQLDSSSYYLRKAYQVTTRLRSTSILHIILRDLGINEFIQGNTQSALTYYKQSLEMALQDNNHRSASATYYRLAEAFDKINKTDSCLYYAKKAVDEASVGPFPFLMLPASRLLAKRYESVNSPEAIRYYKMASAATDSLYGAHKFQQLQLLVLAEQQRQQDQQTAAKAYQSNVRFFSVLVGLGILTLIAFFLYRANRQKHQANQLLNEQKSKVEQTLETLRTTQTQLIQREKMASLGELTAGIAHEIQNPLNFVNNFSEVSVELVEELKQELTKGDTNEAALIADDLQGNLQRITHNGQRASNIVRGMLEHSRTSSGERQPTDLNALAQEYLNLAYQGMRAKGQDRDGGPFNCKLEMDFDTDLPLVSVVAGDLSRVLLNLFNNAFYAVGQKQKTAPVEYQPIVSVSTEVAPRPDGSGWGPIIRVCDNGMGIPAAIKEKIFQPFFTTKPTGEGTGLGLSLSYDIVTKGHGGTLTVESEMGQFTEFIVTLPFS